MGPRGPTFAHLLRGAFLFVHRKMTFPNLGGGSKMGQQKVEIEGVPTPYSDVRTGILWPGPVGRLQMVLRRLIWWQKAVIWGPLGFRAQPAHLNPPISNPPIYPA